MVEEDQRIGGSPRKMLDDEPPGLGPRNLPTTSTKKRTPKSVLLRVKILWMEIVVTKTTMLLMRIPRMIMSEQMWEMSFVWQRLETKATIRWSGWTEE